MIANMDVKAGDFTLGFEYSTDCSFGASKSKKVHCSFYNNQNDNMFSSSLTNLTLSTQYWYRAYINIREKLFTVK